MWGTIAAAAIAGAAALGGSYMTNQANQNLASAQQFNDLRTAQFQADYGRVSEQIQQNFAREMAARSEQYGTDQQVRGMQWQSHMLDRSMAYNSQLMGRQEDFQREMVNSAQAYNTAMSNTSYQRGMADMRAAGLNPMLAYAQGGATAPQSPSASGSMGSVSAPGAPGGPGGSFGGSSQSMVPQFRGYQRATAENMVGPAISNAIQGAKVLTELEQMVANVEQTRQQTRVGQATVPNLQASTAEAQARIPVHNANVDNLIANAAAYRAAAIQSGATAREIDQRIELHRTYGLPGLPVSQVVQPGRAAASVAGREGPGLLDRAWDSIGSVVRQFINPESRRAQGASEERARQDRANEDDRRTRELGAGAYRVYEHIR